MRKFCVAKLIIIKMSANLFGEYKRYLKSDEGRAVHGADNKRKFIGA